MKKRDIFTLLIIVIVFIIAFPYVRDLIKNVEQKEKQEQNNTSYEETTTNPYLEKYAGGYTIEVTGSSANNVAEAYVLHKSGNAKWMWIENDGSGDAKVVSEKMGTWTADEKGITISVTGKSGVITEDYDLVNGIFVNREIKSRYLKKQ